MSGLHEVMAATLALSGMLPSFPSGRRRRANQRPDGTWIMGARERSRLTLRARVDAAAQEMNRCREYCLGLVDGPDWDRVLEGGPEAERFDEATSAMDASRYELDAALAAPRPWRSPRKPDPRNHYSRRHRRACRRCDMYRRTMAVVRCAKRYPLLVNAGFYERESGMWRRNPHGRSGR